ncbi:MAG: hypothetical protein KME04_00560 [Pleurocapsa minor GSE-CHR-MK-17-07R]|jgi:hypothetical protein|nr:hypothetical protein [Pleurocapsa minor GSE-CHR-MK 17-07R]
MASVQTVTFISVGHTVEQLETNDDNFRKRAEGRDYVAITLMLRDSGWHRESESWDASTNRRQERWTWLPNREVMIITFSSPANVCMQVMRDGHVQQESTLLGLSSTAIKAALLADGWRFSHVWGGADGQQHTYFRPA